jgi:endonuclease/exonuclease/phosphatase family metal-dependent hydrolase
MNSETVIRKIINVIGAWFCGVVIMSAQIPYRIMQYNVENLFDTLNHEVFLDDDFTPSGTNQWHGKRYWYKQGRLARVIAAAGGTTPVDIVGMVEVENDSVLHDLLRRTSLARLGYEYHITKGDDERGIQVALLYQPPRFAPFRKVDIPIKPLPGFSPTRHILLVEGRLPSADTLSIFVCHFPSKRGGAAQTEPYRMHVAQHVRQAVDSIYACRPNAMIVVMGDFNADPTRPCLKDGLRVCQAEETPKPFHFIEAQDVHTRNKDIEGTYFFQGEWELIDHIFVSGNMMSKAPLRVKEKGWHILDIPFLLEKRKAKGFKDMIPKRTYKGPHYNGGVSDHLPIVLHLELHIEKTKPLPSDGEDQ